jgi:hypothetical protein
MAKKELLNYRESRMTITNGIVLGPAEVTNDEVRGRLVAPSRTLCTDAEVAAINSDAQVKHLFEVKLLGWGEVVSDEEPAAPAPADQKKK